jgi:signal transduction histidine kinase
MNGNEQAHQQMVALADHLSARRNTILENWRHAVDNDPSLTSASILARKEFYDHIPAVLDAFDQILRARYLAEKADAAEEQKERAAEHGLHRWHHGYNQQDVMREWSHLHLCLVNELENYVEMNRGVENQAMSVARRALAQLCSDGVTESAARYAELQQLEAAGRIRDLEQALEELKDLDLRRADTWRQAVHDVRGNFGVIKTITDQLHNKSDDETLKSEFLSLLQKSVASLHALLNNLLVLSRLEAGHEQRNLKPIDAAAVLKQICESLQPLATERELFLHAVGPSSLPIEGDAINIQRIAQNLILNALKYTGKGGVTVAWEPLETEGLQRWAFSIEDTGPGIPTGAVAPLARAIEKSTLETQAVEQTSEDREKSAAKIESDPTISSPSGRGPAPPQPGEGVGLAIVRRLCELLDATLELKTDFDLGSTFRVVLPRQYDIG